MCMDAENLSGPLNPPWSTVKDFEFEFFRHLVGYRYMKKERKVVLGYIVDRVQEDRKEFGRKGGCVRKEGFDPGLLEAKCLYLR